MDRGHRADQAQRINGLIELHTKKWGEVTKGRFRVRSKRGIRRLCAFDTRIALCGRDKGFPHCLVHDVAYNKRSNRIVHLADGFSSYSIQTSDQTCVTQRTSTMPSATTGRHNHESTTSVLLPINPIITTPALKRRQQARKERTRYARSASLTLRRRSRAKVRGFPLAHPKDTQ